MRWRRLRRQGRGGAEMRPLDGGEGEGGGEETSWPYVPSFFTMLIDFFYIF